jgi:hypothetical protein
MSEEKLPEYFHNVYADTLTVFKRREDAPPEIIYRAEMAAPKPWVGLTVEEIEEIGKPAAEKDGSIQAWGLFAIAIEAKLKEKNT